MKLEISYNIDKEYQNFNSSFSSLNHIKPSPRQQEFFALFSELTPTNASNFVKNYLQINKIDINSIVDDIRNKWAPVENKFLTKASKIFRYQLPFESITAWLTIHDRCSCRYDSGEFFVHLHLPSTNKTIMHELWHFYFYYTVGQKIKEDYGLATYNDLKEALTVLLNIEFTDLLDGIEDKGYPQQAELRQTIAAAYQKNRDIYQTINSTLKIIKKRG